MITIKLNLSGLPEDAKNTLLEQLRLRKAELVAELNLLDSLSEGLGESNGLQYKKSKDVARHGKNIRFPGIGEFILKSFEGVQSMSLSQVWGTMETKYGRLTPQMRRNSYNSVYQSLNSAGFRSMGQNAHGEIIYQRKKENQNG